MKESLKRRSVDSSVAVNLDSLGPEMKTAALQGDGINIYVSITFLQNRFECFSDWGKQEMKCFWRFIQKLKGCNWKDLVHSGGGAHKSGFGMTKIHRSRYPLNGYIEGLEKDLDIFELRVDGKRRIHGCRVGNIFHICWLDRNHRICS
ncbi:MAG6450 family protein [Chitinophaga sp. NPDC101104]|uniref:MAG6450 family protein n=1 Tax=Chitinophaga sp. NPDC101104 TaxID=3390561 RepID=UPI003D0363ED